MYTHTLVWSDMYTFEYIYIYMYRMMVVIPNKPFHGTFIGSGGGCGGETTRTWRLRVLLSGSMTVASS